LELTITEHDYELQKTVAAFTTQPGELETTTKNQFKTTETW